jgi:hypothetical protein
LSRRRSARNRNGSIDNKGSACDHFYSGEADRMESSRRVDLIVGIEERLKWWLRRESNRLGMEPIAAPGNDRQGSHRRQPIPKLP